MKKKIFKILILSIFVLGLSGCGRKEETQKNENKLFTATFNGNESPHIYYELTDRYIYTHDMIDTLNFTYNNETKSLKSWFDQDKDFLTIF